MLGLKSMKTQLVMAISGVSLATTVLIGGFFIYGNVRDNEASIASYRQDLETSVETKLKDETQVAVSILDEYNKRAQSGEMTVEMYDDNDQATQYVLHAGDSVHFGKGTKRGCKNTGIETAQMLTIMIKPQA